MRANPVTLKKSAPSRRSAKRKRDAYNLKVVFIENEGSWSAQVLEHDIATQAKTLKQLFHEVERILVAHVALAAAEGHRPFEGIGPAPRRYWRLFEESHISMRRPADGIKSKTTEMPSIRKEIRVVELRAA